MHIVKSPKPVLAACAFMLLAASSTIIELAKSANAQELPVRCYAFYRNFLGEWINIEAVSVPTRIGILHVRPGHVGAPVAEVLNAYCRGGDTGGE